MSTLTEGAAGDLGRAFRMIRHARQVTLRDAARRAGLSYQYLQNIERGERLTVADDVYHKLARAYEVPENAIDDLVLRARILTALEAHGIERAAREGIWRGVEALLAGQGIRCQTNVAELVAELMVGMSEHRTSQEPANAMHRSS